MKKAVLTLLASASIALVSNAQNYRIEDALSEIKNGNYGVAKEAIDEAAANSSTSNSPKMWKVKGDVYYYIAVDTNYSHIDPNASYVSLESYIKCVQVEKPEKRKKYTPEALNAMVYSAGAVYNKAFFFYEKEDYAKSLQYFEILLTAYETDTTDNTQKKLVPKNDVVQNCANIAIKANDNAKAQKYLQDMINDPKYLSANAYVQLSYMYLEGGDTTKALDIIDKGRKKIPDDKTLFNQELSIYTQLGKIKILLQKLTEVLKNEPNNTLYLFYRGAIVNDNAIKLMETAPQYSDSASEVRKKAKNAAKPADKKKYTAQMDAYIAKRDSIYKVAEGMFKDAEKDYNEALLIDPYYYDALFNMGVMFFNMNKELVDKYNYIDVYSKTAEAEEKEVKNQMQELYKKALEYLEKALEIKSDDDGLLLALQQTYSQLGNNEKSEEMRKLRTGE